MFLVTTMSSSGAETNTWLVLPLETPNAVPMNAELGLALADLLRVELAPDPVVDRDRLPEILQEQENHADQLKLGRLLRATRLISGSIVRETDAREVVVRLRVIQVDSGQVLQTIRTRGDLGKLEILATDLGRQLNLHAGATASEAQVDLEAARFRTRFGRALAAYWSGDPTRAIPGFVGCLKRRPDHVPSKVWLARSYLLLGSPVEGWLVLEGMEGTEATLVRQDCEAAFLEPELSLYLRWRRVDED